MFFSIGHSNRPFDDFLSLLLKNSVTIVADVRHFPSSRKWPQYNQEELRGLLAAEGIGYVHILKLGGRRPTDGSQRNAGWEHKAFRGYADYTATPEFREGLNELIGLEGDVAIMCSEAVPWRCHRRIISDHLTVRGFTVLEIIGPAEPKSHELTSFAHVEGDVITYPSPQTTLG